MRSNRQSITVRHLIVDIVTPKQPAELDHAAVLALFHRPVHDRRLLTKTGSGGLGHVYGSH